MNTAYYTLDIRTDICPMSFVKTKLMLEKMQPGERLEIMLIAGEALENMPRTLAELGHKVVSVDEQAGNVIMCVEKGAKK
jgi:TusA-related sulfurtransferase